MTERKPSLSMQVKDVMTPQLECVVAGDTLRLAATKMNTHNVGAVAVLEGESPVGIVTDRDITVPATAKGLDPKLARVRSAMTPQVVHCFRDQPSF
jgi:predicted transcriptional regulator